MLNSSWLPEQKTDTLMQLGDAGIHNTTINTPNMAVPGSVNLRNLSGTYNLVSDFHHVDDMQYVVVPVRKY
jgi:hypothetical protein